MHQSGCRPIRGAATLSSPYLVIPFFNLFRCHCVPPDYLFRSRFLSRYRHFFGGLTFSTTRAISSGEASIRGGIERGGRPMRLGFEFLGRFGIGIPPSNPVEHLSKRYHNWAERSS